MGWGQSSAAVSGIFGNGKRGLKREVAAQALLLLEEMASVVVTPFVLYFSLPKCAPEILKFVRSFTTHVEGVGDVCSLSAFDFQRHGNAKYGSPLQAPKVAPMKFILWLATEFLWLAAEFCRAGNTLLFACSRIEGRAYILARPCMHRSQLSEAIPLFHECTCSGFHVFMMSLQSKGGSRFAAQLAPPLGHCCLHSALSGQAGVVGWGKKPEEAGELERAPEWIGELMTEKVERRAKLLEGIEGLGQRGGD